MKTKLMITGVVMVMFVFAASDASAQRWGRHGGWGLRARVWVPPIPRVIVRPPVACYGGPVYGYGYGGGYYGGGYYRRGYYGRGYDRGYGRGYYGRGYDRSYGRGYDRGHGYEGGHGYGGGRGSYGGHEGREHGGWGRR